MVTQFGMSEKLGPMTFGQTNEHVFLGRDFGHVRDYSEEIATKIDDEMKTIISKLYEDCTQLLKEKRKHMDAIVQILLDKETIEKDEFKEIVDKVDNGTFIYQEKKIDGSRKAGLEISANGSSAPSSPIPN